MGSTFGGTLEDPEGCSLKIRPNSLYGGKTSNYLLIQQGVEINANLEGGFY